MACHQRHWGCTRLCRLRATRHIRIGRGWGGWHWGTWRLWLSEHVSKLALPMCTKGLWCTELWKKRDKYALEMPQESLIAGKEVIHMYPGSTDISWVSPYANCSHVSHSRGDGCSATAIRMWTLNGQWFWIRPWTPLSDLLWTTSERLSFDLIWIAPQILWSNTGWAEEKMARKPRAVQYEKCSIRTVYVRFYQLGRCWSNASCWK